MTTTEATAPSGYNLPVAASDPDARGKLIAQWVALRAANRRDRARVWTERDATDAIERALAVAQVVGDRPVTGYVAYGVPGAYVGDAWSDAVAIDHNARGEVLLAVLRRDAVRNHRGHGLALCLRVTGKGARAVSQTAREVFEQG